MSSRPLRFLLLAVGLWIGARAAILAPGWWPGREAPEETPPPAATSASTAPLPEAHPPATTSPAPDPSRALWRIAGVSRSLIRDFPYKGSPRGDIAVRGGGAGFTAWSVPTSSAEPGPATALPAGLSLPPPRLSSRASGRWSASAWLLVRRDRGGTTLAQGGILGSSQVGARLSYRLGDGLFLSAGASLPLRRTAGAEVAAGLDWQPVASIPVRLRAERRQALGDEGRSAFALSLHGGASRALPRRLRLDLYGQAGVVGARARDLFVDGAVRVSAPIGPVEIGAAAWGAAQPGAARLDAGPGIAYRLPLRGAHVRIEASWRQRIAGDALPRSGPTLTLGADF